MESDAGIRKALEDWRSWFSRTVDQLHDRDLGIKMPAKGGLALVGVRRSGKTSAAVKIANKLSSRVLYFNFEDPVFASNRDVKNLDRLIRIYEEDFNHLPEVVVLDEIQNIDHWHRWVRKQVDLARFRIIVTGSSAKMLSSDLASSLTGRVRTHEVAPLSFSECLNFPNATRAGTDVSHGALVHLYLKSGGFPEVLLSPEEERTGLLRQYLQDIIHRDVVNRHEVRFKTKLDQITIHLLTHSSCLFSYSSLKKAYSMGVETVENYVNWLQDAYLMFEVPRFHHNLKVQARDPRKIYAIDTGLRNAHSFTREEDLGRLAENAVYLELRRRGASICYGQFEGEVDFVLHESGVPISVLQVSYDDLYNGSTWEREVKGLVGAMKATGCKEGMIITKDREEKVAVDGSEFWLRPLWKWLVGL